jgi:carbon monoxide dehydrogenase subunit G
MILAVELVARGGVEINRSAEEVYDYLADMRNEPQWLSGASGVHLTTPEPIAAGSRFEGTYARAGKVLCELADFDRPRRLTIHGEASAMSFEDTIILTAVEAGTRLAAEMRTVPKGIFKLAAPMMSRVINKQFQANWDHLKIVLEGS